MAGGSAIECTTATWNPTTGCDRISAGCDNCYALALARRLKAMGQPKHQNDGDPRTSGPGFAVTVHPDMLSIPRRWRELRLVFVDSMLDFPRAGSGEASGRQAAAVGEFFERLATLSPRWRLATGQRVRLAAAVAESLTAGWTPAAFTESLGRTNWTSR